MTDAKQPQKEWEKYQRLMPYRENDQHRYQRQHYF